MDLEAAVLAAFPDFEIDEEVLADPHQVFDLPFSIGLTTASIRDWDIPMILIAASRNWGRYEGDHLCRELTDRLYLAALDLCPEENYFFFKARARDKLVQRDMVALVNDCTKEHLNLLIQWAQAYQALWGEWDEDDKLGAIIRCLSARLEAI